MSEESVFQCIEGGKRSAMVLRLVHVPGTAFDTLPKELRLPQDREMVILYRLKNRSGKARVDGLGIKLDARAALALGRRLCYLFDGHRTEEPIAPPPETPATETHDGRNSAAVALGRLGGKKGGLARAKKLSPERRSEIASIAANKRWDRVRAETR